MHYYKKKMSESESESVCVCGDITTKLINSAYDRDEVTVDRQTSVIYYSLWIRLKRQATTNNNQFMCAILYQNQRQFNFPKNQKIHILRECVCVCVIFV